MLLRILSSCVLRVWTKMCVSLYRQKVNACDLIRAQIITWSWIEPVTLVTTKVVSSENRMRMTTSTFGCAWFSSLQRMRQLWNQISEKK